MIVQEKIKQEPSRDKLFTFFGLEVLRDRYLLKDKEGNVCETPQEFIARVSAALARKDRDVARGLYNIISNHYFMPATPILTNIGTNRGLPISCFLNTVPDDIEGIYTTYAENAILAKGGGGIGTNWSDVRGINAKLKTGGKSTGTIPFLKVMDSSTLAVNQGGVRRGSAAAYLDISHPDIEEFIGIRKPTGGDENRKCLNLHHGINVTDKFMEAVRDDLPFSLVCPDKKETVRIVQARELWKKILQTRVETGEPYLLFIDTVNKAVPEHHAEKGLKIKQSNLCSEITLPTDDDRTAVCCLGSLNLEKWNDIDNKDEVVKLAVTALDNTLDIFIKRADSLKYSKARYSAGHERSIGLGVMGWHGYLMREGLSFSSPAALAHNRIIFERIKNSAVRASAELANEKSPPLDGGYLRNSYLLAIAPTANISVICGGATPGIEPIAGNAYVQKTLSGSFLVKNKYLEEALHTLGKNTQAVWQSIISNGGSVAHLEFLNEEQKNTFKTAYEIDMSVVVKQAAERQKYICQAQSLNLFFQPPLNARYLNQVHIQAWEQGCKSLYYLRSDSAIKATKINQEECEACQ
jgi:ribonucleoside-diphosphate reductase alpha chain